MRMTKPPVHITLSKVPEVTFFFWILKIAATTLGETGGESLTVEATFEVPLPELRQAWESTLPALFG